MKKKILVLIIISALITASVWSVCYKPPIMHATYTEIIAIDGFGEVLSSRAITYIKRHPYCDIDDLMNVKGIGEEKLLLLKEEFR